MLWTLDAAPFDEFRLVLGAGACQVGAQVGRLQVTIVGRGEASGEMGWGGRAGGGGLDLQGFTEAVVGEAARGK